MTFQQFWDIANESMVSVYGDAYHQIMGYLVDAGPYIFAVFCTLIVLGIMYRALMFGIFVDQYGIDEDWRAFGKTAVWYFSGGYKNH